MASFCSAKSSAALRQAQSERNYLIPNVIAVQGEPVDPRIFHAVAGETDFAWLSAGITDLPRGGLLAVRK